MSYRSNAINNDASPEEVIVRLFEDGDSEKIMDIDFSRKGVRVYKWIDGGLVKGKDRYDDEDFSTEKKKAMVEQYRTRLCLDNVDCGAFTGDRMVGFLFLFLIPAEKHMWAISHCFVSSNYRRQGIATRMFALAKTKAREAGAKQICFLSAINESAVDFYLSVGFTPHGRPPEEERWLSRWDGEDIYMEMML
jgi:GNAT superfamily N-acetyltransferase